MSGGAAYLKLQGPDNSISQGLQYWGGLQAQRGAERRARNEREGIRKDKKLADWEAKWGLKEGDFQSQYTGFNSYDDIATDFSMKAMEKYVGYQREANAALEAGDLLKKRQLEAKMMKVKGSFKEFSKGQKAYGELNSQYVKDASEGKISGVDASNWEPVMEATAKNFNVAVRFDENDNLVYTGIADLADGTREPFEVANIDLINGNFRPYQKQVLGGDKGVVDNILKTLGKRTTDKRTGFTTTTSQTFDALREKSAKDQISVLTESEEFVADVLNQINGSTKRNGFTAEEKKLVEDKMLTFVKAGYDEEVSQKFDSARASEARKASEKRNPQGVDIQVKTSTAGEVIRTTGPEGDSYQYSIGKPLSLGVGDKSFKINSIAYSPKTGQIAYQGQKLETPKGDPLNPNPTPVWVDVQEGYMDQSQLNNFARTAGFNNANELRQELENKNPQANSTSKGILDDL